MNAPQRRYQVFVSSTFEDLKAERQAAIEAILMCGHIPAGMELFTAGDQSQLEVIREWIEESDVFMLILGARYGSIDPISRKSYIHLEYEHAVSKNKPLFAVIMTDEYMDAKLKVAGKSVIEREHLTEYESFKGFVKQRMSRFSNDIKDIKLAVHESLPSLIKRPGTCGWVRADQVQDPRPLIGEIESLRTENTQLRSQLNMVQAQQNPYPYKIIEFS